MVPSKKVKLLSFFFFNILYCTLLLPTIPLFLADSILENGSFGRTHEKVLLLMGVLENLFRVLLELKTAERREELMLLNCGA